MILVGLLIKTTTGGPAIFSHSRVGFRGKPFNCYKFRSMVANSDEVLKAYLDANPDARKEWEETHKIRNDPRVTFFGRLLRKSSLDELPQFINILRGDMSCVGPRPIVREELRRYGEHQAEYLGTKPGLTGLWQVSGRSSMDYDKRVALDSQYLCAELVDLARCGDPAEDHRRGHAGRQSVLTPRADQPSFRFR